MAVVAYRETERGAGAGIATLLLPRDQRGWVKLRKDAERYSVAKVKMRGKGVRGEMRRAAADAQLLCKLISLCPAKETWKKKHFVEWLIDELNDPTSPASELVIKEAPDLAPDQHTQARKFGWWYRWLGKKMSR